MLDLDQLDFTKGNGLVTVVTQDARTGALLMVAHADREALERTIESGQMHYRSRSRGPWHKGATSGNVQRVLSLAPDCDGDAVLARVVPAGPACHTGATSCFGDVALGADALGVLDRVLAARQAAMEKPDWSPVESPAAKPTYTQRLLGDRNLRLKKLGEEAAELVTACADGDRARAVEEAMDLVYHAMVALRALGVGLDEVRRAAEGRAK